MVRLVKKTFAKNFGDADGFNFAVTRTEAVAVLEHFIQNCLPSFGDYQDAMLAGENEMFHSQIGLYLNNGLLTPLECIEMAEDSFNAGVAPLNSVEGFVRQILGGVSSYGVSIGSRCRIMQRRISLNVIDPFHNFFGMEIRR